MATAATTAVSGSSNTTKTTTTTSTHTTTTSTSVRYACLVSVLQKTLTKSREHFDIKKAVAEVYGDDAGIFGCSSNSSTTSNSNNSTTSSSNSSSNGDNTDTEESSDDVTMSNNMLRQVFESMLDRINEQVEEDMLQDYFVTQQQHDLEQDFLKLEAIVEKLRLDELYQQQVDQADKQSARNAVEGAKRPKLLLVGGSNSAAAAMATTDDVIQLQAFAEMTAQRDALQQQVEEAEAENAKLQETKSQRIQVHKKQNGANMVTRQLAVELDKSADVGSLFADDK